MIKKFITDEKIKELITEFGSPIYIYSENEIKNNINILSGLCDLKNFKLNYATKANSNIEVLKLMKKNHLKVDATGMGEIYINKKAGFDKDNMYVIGNNFAKDELLELLNEDILISADSLDQIEMIGKLKPGFNKLMIRLNPSFGAGKSWRVLTGGKKTKFGIDYEDLNQALSIIQAHDMKLIGINQHIGSDYLEHESLINGVETLLNYIQENNLNYLDVIDFGGGFGLNYMRNHNGLGMDMEILSKKLTDVFNEFLSTYPNKEVSLEFEPGRFLVASAGILVGTVTSIKDRDGKKIIGTDLGFTNFIRPTLYDAYHEVGVITDNEIINCCDIVGNICESGDYISRNRTHVVPSIEDNIIVYDTGAYGYCLASNYNNRLKPCELMITSTGEIKLIRRRQTYKDLLNEY